MRTPAGKECPHFFGDYYRGREREECRLLDTAQTSLNWSRDLCFTCPVPVILSANACPNLDLQPEISRPFPFLKREVRITAHCTKNQRAVDEPKIGCGECHPIPEIFLEVPGDADTPA